jgi:hypothetical protein
MWSFVVSDQEKILHSLFAEVFSDLKQSQDIRIRSLAAHVLQESQHLLCFVFPSHYISAYIFSFLVWINKKRFL